MSREHSIPHNIQLRHAATTAPMPTEHSEVPALQIQKTTPTPQDLHNPQSNGHDVHQSSFPPAPWCIPDSNAELHPHETPFQVVVTEKLIKLLRDVMAARKKSLYNRSIIEIQRKKYENQCSSTRGAQERFRDAARDFYDTASFSGTDAKVMSPLESAFKRMDYSLLVFNAEKTELQKVEYDANRAERRLMDKESVLYQWLSELKGHASMNGHFEEEKEAADDAPSDKSPSQAESARTEAPTVSHYYEKANEAFHLGEDLFNFDADHQQQVFLREERKSLGLPLDSGEGSFLQSYYVDRKEMIKQFSLAKEDAERLYALCVDRGYPVDEPNIRSYVGDVIPDDSTRFTRRIVQLAVAANDEGGKLAQADVQPLVEEQNNEERVSSWLLDLNTASPKKPAHIRSPPLQSFGSDLKPSEIPESQSAPHLSDNLGEKSRSFPVPPDMTRKTRVSGLPLPEHKFRSWASSKRHSDSPLPPISYTWFDQAALEARTPSRIPSQPSIATSYP